MKKNIVVKDKKAFEYGSRMLAQARKKLRESIKDEKKKTNILWNLERRRKSLSEKIEDAEKATDTAKLETADRDCEVNYWEGFLFRVSEENNHGSAPR